jgi:hypothetical protein
VSKTSLHRVEVAAAAVETLVVVGDERSEVHGLLKGHRRPFGTDTVSPDL